ncbi:TSUP family transporter [Petroclostridium xylanilyticum]|uniref:TSUP family transporter n=1 Tax=Petroclostridium xylanilyticum TaxID=1792311 RepID=UPI0018E32A81|nr:TSUP family transporter [Petroclostridium xylanilyticum]
MGFSLTTASGNAKIVNLSSNIAAVITFLMNGKVMFIVGIPAALCCILGHWVGSGLAIKNGAKVIRPAFIGVLAILFIKIGMDLIK